MIPIKREPEDISISHIIEKCYFCDTPTRMWHLKTNNPVCDKCSKTHKVAELPNRFKGEKEPKLKDKLLMKNNKLISEFMGGKEVDWFAERVIIMPFSDNLNRSNYLELSRSYLLDSEVKYHSSWDWLMPVKQKICEIESEHFVLDEFSISENSCCIKAIPIPYIRDSSFISFNVVGDIVNGKKLNDIDVVYYSIVEFIEWYNQNKTR